MRGSASDKGTSMSTRHDGTAVLESTEVGRRLAGKYMGFKLGAENFALEILKVQEIIGLMNITAVPRTPEFVRGVINLRGKVIPVIDLRLKFGMPAKEYTELTCIMVVQVALNDDQVTMGVIVDQVSEVMDIKADQVEEPPHFGAGDAGQFLLGMGKFQNTVVMLLDADSILTAGEMTMVDAMSDEA
ncbi:MAG TPA: chemotaxis protein CheW [Candidatus Krumholzibacteria bacterium]|nr:chemotaxis protein CheW [Candidatus Krumholzibacteria bacterium]HPD71131.1 chemotaxis protein CheW [Candidatus Krumholzibacteria bacterium]HRY39169.1 chemotaxis protein CheW [Candidatus Krumholzibacteria bacterium]